MEGPEQDGIEKSIGVFGRWQLCICIILYLLKIPVAWDQLMIVVIAPPTDDFTCVDNSDKCAANCTEHTFDRSTFTETIITEWDLVCERNYIPNLLQSLIMVGILIGSLLGGYIADRCGRKYVLIYSIVIHAVSGCVAAFMPWLWLFVVVKFLNAASTGTTMLTSFVIIMEIVGIRWRTPATSMFHIPFSIGHLLLAVLAYFIRDWHYLQFACSAPAGVLFLVLWIIPESPRWLISVGKREAAIKVLQRGAKFNGLPIENIPKNVDDYIRQKDLKATVGGNVKELFKSKQLSLKFVFVMIAWFNCGFGYFGVSQFIGYLKGDIIVNVAIAAACSIPGMCLAAVFVHIIGRKPTLFFANVIAGAGMYTLVPFLHLPWVGTVCAAVSIFGLAISFSTVYTYCAELFPTTIRNSVLGLASVSARLGSITAPNIFLLQYTDYEWTVPMIFGTISFMAVIVSLWLPETKNCVLPDSVEDSEQFKITIKCTRHDQYDLA